MENRDALRHVIRTAFCKWEKLPRIPSNWKIVSVQEPQSERYTLQQVTFTNDCYEAQLLSYLEIRNGKIWILTDNAEEGIASKLVVAGMSKESVVLAFYSLKLRAVGEFAVA